MKKMIILGCVLLAATLAVSAQQKKAAPKTYQSILNHFQHPAPGYVLTAAHRGDWRNAPENSINAIDRSIKMGIDIVEIDVRKTKDGQLVLLHDKTIDRTTTGKGKLENWTLDSLKTLKLRQGHGGAVPEKIATLEEAMLFVKGKPVLVNLDKAWECLPETYAVLKKTGTLQQGIFKGNETLAELRQKHGAIMDSIIYMPMVWPMDYNIYGSTAATPADYVKGFLNDFTPAGFEVIFDKESSPVLLEALPFIQQHKITVWINTLWEELCAGHTDEAAILDPEANWGWIVAHGANVIQTDRPVELLAYLRKKRWHE
jgi:glycerophosphoryl diester phosphodiesterase